MSLAKLAERLRRGPVSYDFRGNSACDEARTPIEALRWNGKKPMRRSSPWRT